MTCAPESPVGQIVSSIVDGKLTLREALDVLELQIIVRVMSDCGDNQIRASRVLGIHRNTIRRKLNI